MTPQNETKNEGMNMCRTYQTPTGFFVRLGFGRTPDGKQNYLRRPDGKRAVLTAEEAKRTLGAEIDNGNLNASAKPVYRLVPDSQAANVIPPIPQDMAQTYMDQAGPSLADADYDTQAAPDTTDTACGIDAKLSDDEYRRLSLLSSDQLTQEQKDLLAEAQGL